MGCKCIQPYEHWSCIKELDVTGKMAILDLSIIKVRNRKRRLKKGIYK
jgi:hypothetical protein